MVKEPKMTAPKVIGEKVSLRYAWYALGVLFLVNVINYIDRLSIGPAMEHIKRYFQVSDTQMGLLYSAFILAYAIVSLPMGYLSDRGKRTWIVAIGIGVWSLFTTASAFMPTFMAFFIMRALVGSGEGIYAPTGSAIITDYFPKRLRNTAMSLFMSAMIVGTAIAYVLTGMILKKTDKLDIDIVKKHALVAQNQKIGDWTLTQVPSEPAQNIELVFDKAGKKFTIWMRKYDDKAAATKTVLFNLTVGADKSAATATLATDELALLDGFAQNLRVQEATPFASPTVASLPALPSHFTIPDKMSYDGANKQLVYNGVMSKQEYKALMKLTDNENYQKALKNISSYMEYYYMRTDNWRWIFWIFGPPGLLLALLSFFLKEPLKGGSEEYLSEEQARKADSSGAASYSTIFKTPSVVIMMLSNILVTYCVGGLNIWLFPFVERFKGMDSAEAAIKMGPVVIVFAVLGVIISGILADKLSKKTPYGNTIVMCAGIILGTPFIYLFLHADPKNYFMFMASISLCMFFLTWVNGPQNALLMSLVEPRLRASLNAVHILLIHLLGDALSPVIIGHYSDKYNLLTALEVLPIFIIIGCIGFAFAGIYVPRDLAALEKRMKQSAS